jgi:iron complex outermembrane receptor protein
MILQRINLLNFQILTFIFLFNLNVYSQEQVIEDVIVTAEKRDESLQTVSQAITAITDSEIEDKNITSFVDLTAIVPGVTVAKNEGYKTVISIRGVGNETNQNAIAAASVAYHLDGIFIASNFSLQSDFVDVERIEVARGPQGTLFGQNATGGAINVISKIPSTSEFYTKASLTVGDYSLKKASTTTNFPISDTVATKFSISTIERDGFTENLVNGQDLDDASNISIRSDWVFNLSESSSLRVFGQFFDVDRNGAAMKGIDDFTSTNERKLSQDTLSKQQITSKVFAAIYESDLGYANLKILASTQEDDVLVDRDNDRHNFNDQTVVSIPQLPYIYSPPYYPMAEFRPETSFVETTTFEINLVSNEPALGGKLDWTVGAFFMEHEIENRIRGYVDNDANGVIRYECSEAFADPSYCYEHDYGIPGRFDVYSAEFDFVTDAFPSRKSKSAYIQTTYSFSDTFRLVSGLRYSDDTFKTNVANFFNADVFDSQGSSDKVTGRATGEFDIADDTMLYASFTTGYKPGGTNLTYGFFDDNAPPMVFQKFESETVDSMEFGLKTDFNDGKARANIAVFSYDYENLQFQASDPDVYRGGVANIPESEMSGVELEFTALISDNLTFDMNLASIDSEVSADYEVLDNVLAFGYFFGEEDLRYALRENVKGNELAKTPDFTADLTMTYETVLASGNSFITILQYIKRSEFMQRVSNNPVVDVVPGYSVFNITVGLDFNNNLGIDFMLLNAGDEAGMNSSMTDVFGVAATGLEFIPPRQFMTRLSYDF